MTKLRECCLNITDGEHGSVTDDVNGTCFLLSNKNIIDGKIVISDNDRRISIDVWRNINKRTKLESGDVLISTVGTLGKTAIVKGEVNYDFQRSVGIIKCNKNKLLNKFLYYYLNLPHVQNKLVNTSKGAVQKCIFINDLKDFDIDISDVENQQQIIDVLSALDDKIELNNKVNQELEKTAKDLYNYWFVQFDFPDGNKRPYKSSGGKMVYNDVLKREIPEGWEVTNLLDIVEWVSGAQPPKATFIYQPQNGYVRFIQNRDYAGDTNVTYIKESKNNKVCDVFDIMMDKYGDAGRVRYGLAGAYNVALSKIKVNVRYGQEYIRKFLESDSVYNYLYNACMASTRASLNGEILGNLNIAIPNDTLLKNFEMRNKQIINQILQNKQENEILSNLRDFLLPMLMNGQATVSD